MARRVTYAACVAAAALLASGCGSESVSVPKDDPNYHGATIFAARCGSCHTLAAAGTQGSATNVSDRENVDGPNLNARKEIVPDVLFAIANGGFSGAIMPENIVTGPEAQAVARFVAKYAGTQSAASAGG
jgi:mono/diheme cytochrome c family protein